jgi:hypothetical protein
MLPLLAGHSYGRLMTVHQRVPSDVEAECLADLLNDAKAIPAAALTISKRTARRVIDLSAIPVQRAAVTIPAATASLVEAAENQLAGYRR